LVANKEVEINCCPIEEQVANIFYEVVEYRVILQDKENARNDTSLI